MTIRHGPAVHGTGEHRRPDPGGAVREFLRCWDAVARNLAGRTGHSDYPLCQQRVLLEIGARPGIAMAELRAALDMDAGQLSRTVHDLAACGAVEIREGTADRRRRAVTVTDVGWRAYQELDAAYDTAVGDVLGRFSDIEQTRLVAGMDVVRGLIGTALSRRSAGPAPVEPVGRGDPVEVAGSEQVEQEPAQHGEM